MIKRQTVDGIRKMKVAGERIPMLTVYDYPSALIAERAGIPMLLVGDSAGMVVHGYDTTLPMTVDDMILHAKMVTRASRSALVVVDLPFMSYATVPDAISSARRVMQEGGGQAIKLEGGQEILPMVHRLTAMGVPVMGHLGLTPQAQHQIGLKVQAREASAARQLLDDALALEQAGAFAIVLEVVPAPLAEVITKRLSIPVIGIGAGPHCDGEVQVWHDILGLYDNKTPRHAKRFAEIGAAIEKTVREYAEDVRAGAFPTSAQSASMPLDTLNEVLKADC
ncbi:3-methyl-2-oxobutanoate hydroxymethyltransferase [Gluconobacter kanchanaburiensis]|uniref:3-methyl-2-oxobutanoate hydroxymethyltransferase n=1 Tax=Gluconobacter kanchanaburiensis NBRC 103587 TaxID=1307948 RepID=A0A511B5I2_9PROT|nr:3-methyl-2-oxobutanoate hydroxymethyltransferase [Gluconobacter kanchanaburiensis]MBF0861789.1 3-methyl-2-oxobutanoate hydroxymethyltransferase [Gluconobacter kanchanaburiensis]GBR68064.1 3-methyl-2-oxobutanoate hydroxymethyltransferase [Gluconobacter kanchanaburiensis NBRC 103587]GEK95689.1 3-methyl-2-oxobutanoate hydroxymethyltransferase [Gluconobacter kanchanaburiensis NBRC 103587]